MTVPNPRPSRGRARISAKLGPLVDQKMRLLPWEYGVRNLLRRPTRSLLTLLALTLVILLVLVVVGFLRGLETSLAVSGDPRVVYIHSLGASEHLENSSVPGSTADIVKSSLRAIQRRGGLGREEAYVSPEL